VMSPAFFTQKCGECIGNECINIIKERVKIHAVAYHHYWLIRRGLGLWEHPGWAAWMPLMSGEGSNP
jgi:hypothetical protein